MHFGHLVVDYGELEGNVVSVRFFDEPEGLASAVRQGGFEPPHLEQLFEQREVRLVVVDDQRPRRMERLGFTRSSASHGCDGKNEPEAAPAARLTAHSELTPHHGDELLGDCEAEAGPPVLARERAVGLGERGEKLGLLRLGNADSGVLDFEAELHLSLGDRLGLDSNDDVAVLGELDGVAHDVGEDLAQAVPIADREVGHAATDLHRQLEPLGLSLRRE